MISIWLRDLGLHNSGYGYDMKIDLDNYSDSSDLLHDFYEFINDNIEDKEAKEFISNEEWMITDLDMDCELTYRDINYSEYMSIQSLIDLNEILNEDSNNDIKIKCLMSEGVSLTESFKLLNSLNIFEVEKQFGFDKDFGNYICNNCEDFGIDTDNELISYVNWEHLGREFGWGYSYEESQNSWLVFNRS